MEQEFQERDTDKADTNENSWDPFIDSLIAHSKGSDGTTHIDRACIIGLEQGNLWTSPRAPTALKISPRECEQIAKCMRSKDFTSFQSVGVTVDDTDYLLIRAEDNISYARCGAGSVSIQCTKQTVIIAHSPHGKQQGNMNKALGKLAQYLESMGY